MKRVRYRTNIKKLEQISDEQKRQLIPVAKKYKYRANDYYLGLINWDDPNDPIRKIIIPREEELNEFGRLDASNEDSNYAASRLPAQVWRYRSAAL